MSHLDYSPKLQRWTEKEIETLRQAWATDKPARLVADELNRPLKAVYQKAHKLKLSRREPTNKIKLSPSDLYWLKCNYPHVRTEICSMRLGISHRTCVRIARKLGVEKTAQFMKETQAVTAKKAKGSHLRNGTYPAKGWYSPNLQKGAQYQFKAKT